jgi:hypothetical protein
MRWNDGEDGNRADGAPRALEGRRDGIHLEISRLAGDEASRVVDECVYLTGRPPLNDFRYFMTVVAENGHRADERPLIAEWRAAAAYIAELRRQEAGIADNPTIEPVPRRLEALRDRVLEDPVFRHAFQVVPTDIGFVELDRLVVFQKWVNRGYLNLLQQRLGPSPIDEEIFETCLPFDHPKPPVKWMQTHRDTFVLVSPSNDLRFIDSVFLDPSQIVDRPPAGTAAGIIGLVVGFGSNFLNAVHAENRLVLINGTHRAYSLRSMGVTHAPCIIQHVSTREELQAAAMSDLRANPDSYLRQPRPSMFRDYFDPKLSKIVPVPRRLRQLTVKFSVDVSDLPAV